MIGPTIRAISLLLTTALVLGSLAPYMLQSFRGELPHSSSVLVDQTRTNQELLGDFGHGASRQAEDRGNYVRVGSVLRPGSKGTFVPVGPRPRSSICSSWQARSKCGTVIVWSPWLRQTRRQLCSNRSASRGVPRDRRAISGRTSWSTSQLKCFAPMPKQQAQVPRRE